MISTQSTKGIAWPVPWDTKTIFYFRAGNVEERAQFEAELAGEYDAGRVFDFQMASAFATGVEALLKDDPDGAAQLLEWQQIEAGEDALAPEEATALAAARDTMRRHWPPYKALVKKAERRSAMTPVLAFRTFCERWEGKGLPAPERGPDGLLTLECLQDIEALAIHAGGAHAYAMLYGGGKELEGNSARPSKSEDGPTTSSSDSSAAGGSSAKGYGTKTRSSSSRPGRSPSSTAGSTAGV